MWKNLFQNISFVCRISSHNNKSVNTDIIRIRKPFSILLIIYYIILLILTFIFIGLLYLDSYLEICTFDLSYKTHFFCSDVSNIYLFLTFISFIVSHHSSQKKHLCLSRIQTLWIRKNVSATNCWFLLWTANVLSKKHKLEKLVTFKRQTIC